MQLIAKQFFQSLTMAGVIPAIIFGALSNRYSNAGNNTEIPKKETSYYEIQVLDQNGELHNMDLEEYVTCVVLGEVSAQFHEEALKAQAVAARTYTLYCMEVLKKHTVGAVCTDYRCCQAYCEPDEYVRNGGTLQGIDSVTTAVEATAREVISYDSDLICATYFASSGGNTEDALEVWGRTYPYLQSVESPGEENCGYFSKQEILTPMELQNALGVQLKGEPSSWFGMVKYTVGGGVDLMRIGGRLYTGVELRKLLKLRSTVFTVTVTDDAIIIDTKGYGHRVGMSQHGANAMAQKGADYRHILAHYYKDTVLEQLDD